MKGYLFDTCTVRKWYGNNAAVCARVSKLPGDASLFISAITIGEIEFAHTNIASDPAAQAAFRRWIATTFQVPELEVTGSTGWEYAAFRRQLFDRFAKKGKYTEDREDCLGSKIGVDENDLWLVAQAKERGLKFITMDKMTRINEVCGSSVDIDKWPEFDPPAPPPTSSPALPPTST